ncbi:MAG: alanine racemase, partial [Janthinobacterium lividum]
MTPPTNLRLTVDIAALVANWRVMARASGAAACGAAVKADGYGLGAREVVAALAAAGCRDFFVATWTEAALLEMPPGARLAVLHGVQEGEMAMALGS